MTHLPHNSTAASLLSAFFVDIINAIPEVEIVCSIAKCDTAEKCRSSLHASGCLISFDVYCMGASRKRVSTHARDSSTNVFRAHVEYAMII